MSVPPCSYVHYVANRNRRGRPRDDGRARRGLMHKVYYTLVTDEKIVWIE